MKGEYIEILKVPKIDEMEFFTYEQIEGPKKPKLFIQQGQINYYISKEDRKKVWKPNPYKYYTGIYFLTKNKKVVYVGETTKLTSRIKTHKQNSIVKKDFNGLYFLPVKNEWERKVLETIYIEMHHPEYNRKG